MALQSFFEFFELVAQELSSQTSRVITEHDLVAANGSTSTLVDDLKIETKSTGTSEAIDKAVKLLTLHFLAKGSRLPFEYDSATGRFSSLDHDYLVFVADMVGIRSVGKRSRDFETSVAERLKLKVTGEVHRVGFPRDTKKLKPAFVKHLQTLGFSKTCLLGHEKDGGLDILWMLPLGSIPHRPILSLQCKNSFFNQEDGDVSVMTGNRTLGEHDGLQASIHVPCVLYNDYVTPNNFSSKRMNFVPLGLSDLALLDNPVSLTLI
jgi:hypothetical protein